MSHSNRSKDDTGYSWQKYDDDGKLVQGNSKSTNGEHKWYNTQDGSSGYHGPSTSDEEKAEAGKYFRDKKK